MRIFFFPFHLGKIRKVAENQRNQDGEAGGRRCVFYSVDRVTRDSGVIVDRVCCFL